MPIYLDNAATTKPKPEVAEAVLKCYNNIYGNPSSAHILGIEAERTIKQARETVARAFGAKPAEIIFTSGGTESNNMAIKGVSRARNRQCRHLITTAIEHPSVLESCQDLVDEGFTLTILGVDKEGYIDLKELEQSIRPETILISIMHVNNETGVVQPIKEIGKIIKGQNSRCLFHVDAVQSFGKLPLRPKEWQIDLLSVSGHKIHGPKGIGALFIREGLRIRPILSGGGQERELRSGTENVPGIAGFGVAVKIAEENMKINSANVTELREYLQKELLAQVPDIKINSPVDGLAHILNVSFRGVKGEVLLHALEGKNIFVSTGSACSSKKFLASNVLKAMGLNKSELAGGIRFSLSAENNMAEIKQVITDIKVIVEELRKFARRSR